MHNDMRNKATANAASAHATGSSNNADNASVGRANKSETVPIAILDNDCFALRALVAYCSHMLPQCHVVFATTNPQAAIARCTRSGAQSDMQSTRNSTQIGTRNSTQLNTHSSTAIGAHVNVNAPMPRVLLVDMSLGEMQGAEVIRHIRQRNARIILLAITSFPREDYAQAAASAGAQGIISKNAITELPRIMQQALLEAAHAECNVSRETPQSDVRKDTAKSTRASENTIHFETPQAAYQRLQAPQQGIAALTQRERSIIALCSKGYTTAQIAAQLGVSAATIATHVQRACEKTHAKNRIHLVTLWIQQHAQ